MNSQHKSFGIIAAVVVLALIGVVVYAYTQRDNNHMDTSMQGMTGQQKQAEGSDKSTNDTTNPVATNSVEIKDYAYSPTTITVKVGTKVTWTNQDTVKHTVTSDPGTPAVISSELFGKGESFSYTFDKAGTYTYFCEPHPYMKGTVVVTE
jgi:amicyanin